jgi:uncharacterized protein YjiK
MNHLIIESVRYTQCLLAFLIGSLLSDSCNRISHDHNNQPPATIQLLEEESYDTILNGSCYYMDDPDEVITVPEDLEEISGICLIDSVSMAAVQDELGIIYILDLPDGKIKKTIDFAGPGDYEDIALVRGALYVLKSNGTLYEIKEYDSDHPLTRIFNTRLRTKNNCEGLAYDPEQDALLIACKGSPSIEKKNPYKGYRAVYRFSIEKGDVGDDPFLLIAIRAIPVTLQRDWYERLSVRLANRLDPNGSILFQPSGIAVHPLTGQLYILAHVGKLLVVADRDGSILQAIALQPKLFRQPEGICFDPGGTLYIASEGNASDGIILVHHPKMK